MLSKLKEIPEPIISKSYDHLIPKGVPIFQMTSQDHITYLKNEMIKEQNNKCLLCEQELTKSTLDHSHRSIVHGTGLIRGVLCSSCNMLEGKLANNAVRNGLTIEQFKNFTKNIHDYIFVREHKPYVHANLAPVAKRLKKNSYKKLIEALRAQGSKESDLPDYPKTQRYGAPLQRAFAKVDFEPEFLKG